MVSLAGGNPVNSDVRCFFPKHVNIGDRINTTYEIDGITVSIRLKRNWALLLSLALWLVLWTFFGVLSLVRIATGEIRDPMIYVWLCGWLLGEIFVTLTWLWAVFGRETICVRSGTFIYKREICGRGSVQTYPVQEVSNLRASGFFADSDASFENWFAQWGLGGGTVAIDTKYGSQRFGIQLTEPDANALAKALEPFLKRNIEQIVGREAR